MSTSPHNLFLYLDSTADFMFQNITLIVKTTTSVTDSSGTTKDHIKKKKNRQNH